LEVSAIAKYDGDDRDWKSSRSEKNTVGGLPQRSLSDRALKARPLLCSRSRRSPTSLFGLRYGLRATAVAQTFCSRGHRASCPVKGSLWLALGQDLLTKEFRIFPNDHHSFRHSRLVIHSSFAIRPSSLPAACARRLPAKFHPTNPVNPVNPV
jgi:hypothetical protein